MFLALATQREIRVRHIVIFGLFCYNVFFRIIS
jgi:hypothetical protein